jgi:hypothetical protein
MKKSSGIGKDRGERETRAAKFSIWKCGGSERVVVFRCGQVYIRGGSARLRSPVDCSPLTAPALAMASTTTSAVLALALLLGTTLAASIDRVDFETLGKNYY